MLKCLEDAILEVLASETSEDFEDAKRSLRITYEKDLSQWETEEEN